MTNALEVYQQLIATHKEDLKKLEKLRSVFGWIRLLTMGFALASLWWLWSNGSFTLLPLPFLFIGLFLFILKNDLNNNVSIENLLRLILINETEIAVLRHQFSQLPEGNEFKQATHEYANDLDIFGHASLFQYINRCTSEHGKKLFSDWLLQPASPETIRERQEGVKELATLIKWRQQLQSTGTVQSINIVTENKIREWLTEPLNFINKPGWRLLRFLLPAISFTLLGLHIAGIIAANIFYPLIASMLLTSLAISRLTIKSYIELNKIATQLETLSESIEWIENIKFKSKLLIQLQAKYSCSQESSSRTIKKLKKILDRFDIRLNPLVFIPLNTFLYWDLQQVLILEQWKKENKEHISDWFQSLAEIESLCSLANLSFNHPDWAFPVLAEAAGSVTAVSLGHPLIPKENLVRNSFSTAGTGELNLVTGSNMAGKSTFLRSIGVNIVLAMMGAPVCAESFTVSHIKVFSSMRINDNLEENTSTFYAELKKLKEIIESVYQKKEVFLLLDEILRGTNSADRHTGSKALIKQLIEHEAAGLIATHDLELTKLENDYPGKLHNYHFDVQVKGEELYFDYKLKKGICTSMNASLLMKKIGIEL